MLAAIDAVVPGADVQRIRPAQPLRAQLELDSLDWLNVVEILGERLSVPIPASDHGQLDTLDALVDYLGRRLTDRRAPPPSGEAPDERGVSRHVLRDTPVTIRPLCADDKALEASFVRRLSAEARYNRFMVTMKELPEKKLDWLTSVDQARHVALVATVESPAGCLEVGVVHYFVDAPGTGCEFAVAVDDAWQGSGLAGILMQRLIDIARARGLATMEGLVLVTNRRMRKLARQLGFVERSDAEDRRTVRIVRSLREPAGLGPGRA
ncbi:GNAT family N-acetyltransferase [Aquabacterium humicola]|uniref:GNAT family N-acetyltransferase n=1 Tax=Aquabacterium humicola TaxID=3237377 RepID=UPI002543B96C|nr:GNAT family N-acetyltransferase [Rubrivivax pictus]